VSRVDGLPDRKQVRIRATLLHPAAWAKSRVLRRHAPEARPVPTGANDVLERLAELPVSAWTYGFEHSSVRHLGPMAQDFAETFGLGSSTKTISAVDANGVCIASIQALYRRLVEVEKQLEELRAAQEPSLPSA
jgi:hypothetical protein